MPHLPVSCAARRGVARTRVAVPVALHPSVVLLNFRKVLGECLATHGATADVSNLGLRGDRCSATCPSPLLLLPIIAHVISSRRWQASGPPRQRLGAVRGIEVRSHVCVGNSSHTATSSAGSARRWQAVSSRHTVASGEAVGIRHRCHTVACGQSLFAPRRTRSFSMRMVACSWHRRNRRIATARHSAAAYAICCPVLAAHASAARRRQPICVPGSGHGCVMCRQRQKVTSGRRAVFKFRQQASGCHADSRASTPAHRQVTHLTPFAGDGDPEDADAARAGADAGSRAAGRAAASAVAGTRRSRIHLRADRQGGIYGEPSLQPAAPPRPAPDASTRRHSRCSAPQRPSRTAGRGVVVSLGRRRPHHRLRRS